MIPAGIRTRAGLTVAAALAVAAGGGVALGAPGLAAGAATATTTAGTTTTTTSTTETTPASSPVTLTLTPDTPSAGSTLALDASNIPAQGTSLPQSLTVSLPGFSTSTAKGVADSVAVFCTATQASKSACPAASQAGSGSATIVATLKPQYQAFNPGPITASLAIYLEAPSHAGAVADAVITATTKYGTQSIGGYLTSTAAGLSLIVPDFSSFGSQFAAYQTYVQSSELQSLTLSLRQHRNVRTVVTTSVRRRVTVRVKQRVRRGGKTVTRYVRERRIKRVVVRHTVKSTKYLVINPSTCTSTGWPGSLTLDYASGPVTYTATGACSS